MVRFNPNQVDLFVELGEFNPIDEFVTAFRAIKDPARRCEILIKIFPYQFVRREAPTTSMNEQAELLSLIKR